MGFLKIQKSHICYIYHWEINMGSDKIDYLELLNFDAKLHFRTLEALCRTNGFRVIKIHWSINPCGRS